MFVSCCSKKRVRHPVRSSRKDRLADKPLLSKHSLERELKRLEEADESLVSRTLSPESKVFSMPDGIDIENFFLDMERQFVWCH